jgi:hypothetical protein
MRRGSSFHRQYKDFLVAQSTSADHRRTTNFAGPNDVSLCCVKAAVSNVFWGTLDSKCLLMRLVASGVCAVRVGTENSNDLEREIGSQAVSKLHRCTPYSNFGSKVPSTQGIHPVPGNKANSNLLALHVQPGCVCLIHRCSPHPDNEALHEYPRNVQDIHCIQNYPDNVVLPTPATLLCCNMAYPDQLARMYEAGPVQALCRCETNSNRLEGLDGSSGLPAFCKRPYDPNVLATKRRSSCAAQDLGSQRHPNILALSLISQTAPLVHLCPSHLNILEIQDVVQCV